MRRSGERERYRRNESEDRISSTLRERERESMHMEVMKPAIIDIYEGLFKALTQWRKT